jgi:hypothetical protein
MQLSVEEVSLRVVADRGKLRDAEILQCRGDCTIFDNSKTAMQNTSRILNHCKPRLTLCCPANIDEIAASKKRGIPLMWLGVNSGSHWSKQR